MLVYVDGVLVGETATGEPTPHLLINRLCEGQTSESDAAASRALGFRMELPPLQHGRHEARTTYWHSKRSIVPDPTPQQGTKRP